MVILNDNHVQASANTILSHFLGLSSSLELLRYVTEAAPVPVPKPAWAVRSVLKTWRAHMFHFFVVCTWSSSASFLYSSISFPSELWAQIDIVALASHIWIVDSKHMRMTVLRTENNVSLLSCTNPSKAPAYIILDLGEYIAYARHLNVSWGKKCRNASM